jgi:heme A synthase
MSKASFCRVAPKASEAVHYVLFFALFIGPVVAVGAGRRSQDASFFERYLLAPTIVFFVVIALGVINFIGAAVIKKLFATKTG